MNPSFENDILPRLKKRPNGCWEWEGARHERGYGLMTVGGKTFRLHRIALEHRLGEPLGRLHALHSCDNPPCCNPEHLFAGTNLQNRKDGIDKGRVLFGLKGKQPWTVGAKHHNAKLTAGQVTEIRAHHSSGTHTASELAKLYRVKLLCIHRVLRRMTWRHV